MAASNELLKYSLENTNARAFYYYPLQGLMVAPESTCAYYHCKKRYEDMPHSFMQEFIAAEYQAAFGQMFQQIKDGQKTATCEAMLKDKGIWCRFVLSTVPREREQAPWVVVGIAEDISKEKNIELENIQLQAIYDFIVNHDYDYLDVYKRQTNTN